MRPIVFFLLAAVALAQTFCRCEDQSDLSYLLFDIDDGFKSEIEAKFKDAKFTKDCSYCTKMACQYKFEKESDETELLQTLSVNCFKRESRRDQIVIYGFLSLTIGLLLYPYISKWIKSRSVAI